MMTDYYHSNPKNQLTTGGVKDNNRSLSFYTKRPNQLEVDRLVVYKKGKIIQNDYYIVEISYNSRGLFISLFSMEDESKNKVLEIENFEKVTQIVSAFKNDFELMSDHIKVVKEGIKIRKPKSLSKKQSLS